MMTYPRKACLVGAVATMAALATGCADVDYRPATTHNEVINITEKQVLAGQRVKLRQDGRVVHLQVKRVCDVVEDKEMERVSVRKSDENIVLETVLMSLATAPLATGGVVLWDSQNVHDSDTHSRLYNETGQGGAQVAGALSLVLGTGMMVGGMISLIHKSKPKISESTYHEDGKILAANQPCLGGLRNARVSVQGMLDDGSQVPLGSTNEFGELTVDLGRVVPANRFAKINPPTSLEVRINNVGHGLVDLEMVAEHHEKHRERVWANAEPEQCEEARTQAACQGVQQFLGLFPHGRHATEARTMISNIGKTNVQKAKTGPLQKIAKPTCPQMCRVKCESSQSCIDECVTKVCK